MVSDTRVNERTKTIKRASWIAIVGNTVLALLKIIVGITAGSLAVVGDGIDTTTDIITSLVILFAAVIMAKPPDKGHPYGHWRAEAIATKLVSFVIFFAGAQLALSTIHTLMAGEVLSLPGTAALYITVVSIVGKIFLAYSQLSLGKRHDSAMLIANGKNMLNDIYISGSVIVGLAFTFIFKAPILDPIIALVVSIWVMRTAVMIFIDSSVEVMEGIRDHSVYDEIFAAVGDVDGASKPHRTRIRQISTYYVVDLDIEVDAEMTVARGHEIAVAVEDRIKNRVKNVYDVIVHVEPCGNLEENEAYGRSQDEK